MDRARLAEWMLAPALGSARASWVVGDLLEAGAARPPGWFWVNVARTWGGAVWNDFRAQPWFCLELAARAALLLSFSFFCVWRIRILTWDLVRASLSHSHFLAKHPKEWLWPAVKLASLLATFYVGRWIARRSSGRELAVCLAMALVYPVVAFGFGACWAAATAAAGATGTLLPEFGRFWYHAKDAAFIAAFLLGVALLRRPAAEAAAA
jgi:hypothetical protein